MSKKMIAKLPTRIEKVGFDEATLKRWKNSSTKAKLVWLDQSLRFAAAKKS